MTHDRTNVGNNPAYAGHLLSTYLKRLVVASGGKVTVPIGEELDEIGQAFMGISRRLVRLEKTLGGNE
jgi:hypothetical protein